MSIGFAYRAHDGLAVGFPFRGCWLPASNALEIGTMPVDGTLTDGDYPAVCEPDADPSRA